MITGVTKKQLDMYMARSGIVAEKKTQGGIFKLHRIGVMLQLEYWKDGQFSHIVTASHNHQEIKSIFNDIKED